VCVCVCVCVVAGLNLFSNDRELFWVRFPKRYVSFFFRLCLFLFLLYLCFFTHIHTHTHTHTHSVAALEELTAMVGSFFFYFLFFILQRGGARGVDCYGGEQEAPAPRLH